MSLCVPRQAFRPHYHCRCMTNKGALGLGRANYAENSVSSHVFLPEFKGIAAHCVAHSHLGLLEVFLVWFLGMSIFQQPLPLPELNSEPWCTQINRDCWHYLLLEVAYRTLSVISSSLLNLSCQDEWKKSWTAPSQPAHRNLTQASSFQLY